MPGINEQIAATRSQEWIRNNFEHIVSKYGGMYIGVINEEVIGVALTPREIIKKAKEKGKEEEDISLLKVPTEDELICVL